MAQPKLEDIDKRLSVAINDAVSSAGTDGQISTGADRLEAINEARLQLYDERLGSIGMDEFVKNYPEFCHMTDYVAKSSGVYTKPAETKKILSVEAYHYMEPGSYTLLTIPKEMPAGLYNEAMGGTYSSWKPKGSDDWKWAEFDNAVKLVTHPVDGTDTHLKLNIVLAPVKAVMGGGNPDICEPPLWSDDIIKLAASILLNDIINF